MVLVLVLDLVLVLLGDIQAVVDVAEELADATEDHDDADGEVGYAAT